MSERSFGTLDVETEIARDANGDLFGRMRLSSNGEAVFRLEGNARMYMKLADAMLELAGHLHAAAGQPPPPRRDN